MAASGQPLLRAEDLKKAHPDIEVLLPTHLGKQPHPLMDKKKLKLGWKVRGLAEQDLGALAR